MEKAAARNNGKLPGIYVSLHQTIILVFLKITVIVLYSYTCIKMCNRFSALIEGLYKLDPLNIHASSSFKT